MTQNDLDHHDKKDEIITICHAAIRERSNRSE